MTAKAAKPFANVRRTREPFEVVVAADVPETPRKEGAQPARSCRSTLLSAPQLTAKAQLYSVAYVGCTLCALAPGLCQPSVNIARLTAELSHAAEHHIRHYLRRERLQYKALAVRGYASTFVPSLLVLLQCITCLCRASPAFLCQGMALPAVAGNHSGSLLRRLCLSEELTAHGQQRGTQRLPSHHLRICTRGPGRPHYVCHSFCTDM